MKKNIKNILTNAAITTALTFSSLLNPNYAIAQTIPQNSSLKNSTELPSNPQHPMYGLNLYVPAHDIDYQTNTDWYGSGDVNGDGIIDMVDYNSSITGTNPFKDGTHRGDTDLNGISGQPADKAIILEYINGTRTHINMWELETIAEKRNHLAKAIAIDQTDKIPYNANGGWVCYNFSIQTFINFNGVYDIENSIFAKDNNTNLQYDISHNGIFRISLRDVVTFAGSGVAHSINNVYLGSPENQDATVFENKIYIEPQTDVIQKPGDYSLTQKADEKWYGYYYNNFLQQWKFGSRDLINYDLNTNPPTMGYKHSGLVISWNPFQDIEYPVDQNHEYFPGIENNLEMGEINNFIYANETKINKTITSNQIMDGSKNQYNYDVNVLLELTAGAYNPQNTLDAIHNQTLKIRDTTPPVYNEETGVWTDSSGSSVTSLEERVVNGDICKSDTIITKTGTDVSGNQSQYIKEIIGEPYTGTPYLVSDPHQGDTLRIELETTEIPENIGGWPEYKDDKANVTMNYTIEQIKMENLEWLKKMVFTATNQCGNVSPEKVERFYWKPSGVGTDAVKERTILIYPNPANEFIVISWDGFLTLDGQHYFSCEIIDMFGKLIFEKEISSSKFEINISGYRAGVYMLRFNDGKRVIMQQKIVIR